MKIDSKNLFGYSVFIVTTMAGSLSLILFGFFLYGVSFTVAEFGKAYLDYQGKVPMLIPWKLKIPNLPGGSDDGIG